MKRLGVFAAFRNCIVLTDGVNLYWQWDEFCSEQLVPVC